MKGLAWLTLYVLAVLLLGGLLAYPAHFLTEPFFDFPFHRITKRALMLAALLLLPAYLRVTRANTLADAGLDIPRSKFASDLFRGFLAGVLSVTPLIATLVALGIRTPSALSLAAVLRELPVALALAMLVGLLEETYFRGAILGGLLRDMRAWSAVLASSLLYGIVHFLVVDAGSGLDPPHWYTGVLLVAHGWTQLLELGAVWDALLALVVAGVFLGALRLTRGIGLCVGLHAGWVFGIRFMHRFTDLEPASALRFLVGALDGVMGLLATLWIVVMASAWLAWSISRDGRAPVGR